MAVDFSAFDMQVSVEEIKKRMEESQDFEDIPTGEYIVDISNMKLGAVKSDGRPMFQATLKVKEGKYKNRLIFVNRTVKGTKDDFGALKWVCNSFLNKLVADGDKPITFNGMYNAFAEDILDLYQSCSDTVELKIYYDPNSFNKVKIIDVYDI